MVRNVVVEWIDRFQPELIGIGGLCIDYHCIRTQWKSSGLPNQDSIVLGGGIVNHDDEFIFDT